MGRRLRELILPNAENDTSTFRKEMTQMALQLAEMDAKVSYAEQLQQETGPVVPINKFNVASGNTAGFLETSATDAAFIKQQPGYISTQLHRGIGGSTTFVNVAVPGIRVST